MTCPSSLFLVSLLCFIFVSCESTDLVYVNGTGATFGYQLFSEWFLAYSLSRPSVVLQYTPTSSGFGIAAVKTGSYTYSFSATPLTEAEFQSSPGLVSFPLLAGPVAFVYNLKSWNSSIPLTLSMDILIGIFTGEITSWNDSKILESIDPQYHWMIPNSTLIPVIRSDKAGTTSIVSASFERTNDDRWTFNSSSTWPKQLSSTVDYVAVPGNIGVYAAVNMNLNSIGYISFSNVNTGAVKYAFLRSSLNRSLILAPTSSSVKSLMEIAQLDNRLNADLIDSSGKHWPFVGFVYTLIYNETKRECTERLELLRFINWCLTNELASKRAMADGYATLPEIHHPQVYETINSLSCNGIPLLKVTFASQHVGPGYIIVLILSWIGIIISLLIAWGLLRFPQPTTSKVMTVSHVSGAILIYLSVIWWYLDPTDDWICSIRIWFTLSGYSLSLASLFTKTWLFHAIFRNFQSNKRAKRAKNQNFNPKIHLFATMTLSLLIQLILLIVWTTVDPFSSRIYVKSSILLEYKYGCYSNNLGLWLGLEAFYFGIILIWGLYIVYRTWNLKNSLFESRWILMSIYNLILALCLLGAFLGTTNMSDSDIFYLVCLPLLFTTTFTMVMVSLPKILKWEKMAKSTPSTTGSIGGHEKKSGSVVP